MSKARLNADNVTNELMGASAFFKPSPPVAPESAPTAPPSPEPQMEPEPKSVIPVQAPTRTPRTGVLPDRPAKRQMIRHPFELYMDQLDQLRDLADAQRRRGEPGSMSRMVREAIDRYLDEHPKDA